MISPKAVFQTLRKLQLTKEDLKKDIKEFNVDGVIVIINGNFEVLDINFDAVKNEKDIEQRIKNAVNQAISAIKNQHFQTLQNIDI